MTNNKAVLSWVEEIVALTKPDRVVWIDGSEEQQAEQLARIIREVLNGTD